MTNSWDNIYTDGRRLEKIIRFCETMIFKKDIDEQLKLSYIDRMIKATRQKVEIMDKVLAVEHIVKGSVRNYNKTHKIPYDPSEKYRTIEGR